MGRYNLVEIINCTLDVCVRDLATLKEVLDDFQFVFHSLNNSRLLFIQILYSEMFVNILIILEMFANILNLFDSSRRIITA